MLCELNDYPWPHLVVDGFLSESALETSIAEITARQYEFELENRGTGRIEFSLLQSEQLWREIYSRRTISLIKDAFGVSVTLDKHNMLQLRRMNEHTPDFPLHNDHVANADTIASFLYLSPNWNQNCGGFLNLFKSDNEDQPSISIEPLQNRFVAFRTTLENWHSVSRVRAWERLSVLALWNVMNS